MRRIHEALDIVAIVLTIALALMVAANQVGPVRLLLALGFVTFVPGWALLDYVSDADVFRKLALAVAASFTICAIPGLAMVWARSWRPFGLFYALAIASTAALIGNVARRRRWGR